jgi:hypothetical protein
VSRLSKKADNSPDLLIQVNKDKLKPWHIAVIVIVGLLCYFLMDFLKSTLESKLIDNQNILVLVLVVGLVGFFLIIYFSISKISEKK